MPIGMPGWPEFACCTASIASARMALASSTRSVIGFSWRTGGVGGTCAIITGGAASARFRDIDVVLSAALKGDDRVPQLPRPPTLDTPHSSPLPQPLTDYP